MNEAPLRGGEAFPGRPWLKPDRALDYERQNRVLIVMGVIVIRGDPFLSGAHREIARRRKVFVEVPAEDEPVDSLPLDSACLRPAGHHGPA